MGPSRFPLAGILLVCVIGLLAAGFALANWHWLDQRDRLERGGVPALARITAVSASHKACNAGLELDWTDGTGKAWTGRFTTCFANRTVGGAVPIRFLADDPATAMIAPGEGGLPDDQFRTGMWIGAVVALAMGVAAGRLLARA